MRGKVSRRIVFAAEWGKPDQVRKFRCAEPWESAAAVHPPKRQASVPIEPVPPQICGIESLAAHGLHRIPENPLHPSDFCEHARSIRKRICDALLLST